MARDLDKQLGAFKEKDYSVRLCAGIDRVLPFSPELRFYDSLEGAAAVVTPGRSPAVVARAREIAEGPQAQKVLMIVDMLDRADTGLSIYTGVSTAVKAWRADAGQRIDTIENDNQQATDAVLKGLGLAWMVHELFEGSFKEKAEAFMALDAGKQLAAYYAAVEVGLPFADNAATSAGGLVSSLFERHGGAQVSRLAGVTGELEADEAEDMAKSLLGTMEGMVQQSAQYLGTLAQLASEFAPRALDVADKVAGVAAAGADALPVWRFLGARLVAEAALVQAAAEIDDGMHPAFAAYDAAPAGTHSAPSTLTPAPPAQNLGPAIAVAALGILLAGGLGALVYTTTHSAPDAAEASTGSAYTSGSSSSSGASSSTGSEDGAGDDADHGADNSRGDKAGADHGGSRGGKAGKSGGGKGGKGRH
jgi:hypothetical protein